MKIRVYKIAAMAVIGLIGFSTKNYAQKAATAPAPATAPHAIVVSPDIPAPPVIPDVSFDMLAKLAPLTTTLSTNLAMDMSSLVDMGINQNDTTYKKKMQKLQAQMRELQKQMSTLRVDEIKKSSAEISKKYAEKSKMFAYNFDKNFAGKFKDMGQNMRFNFEKSDAELDKKVQSGDVKLKSKTYSKSYPVDANDKLQIDNRYGKVTVNTWNKNEFKVDVEIKAYANDDDAAQKLLDQVNITDSKENSVVAFTTVIGDKDHSKTSFWTSWSSDGKASVNKTIINYTVYMPSKSALSITNHYGGTVLPDMNGRVTINSSYGSLVAKALTNTGNVINVKYGSADIESLIGSDLDVAYGSLNLQSADKLNADVSYGSAKIGRISTTGVINVKYGGLQISDLGRGLKNLSVNSSYSPVKLGSLANTNADFDVTIRLGGFSYDNGVNVISTTPDDAHGYSTTKTYKGHIGKGNSDNLVVIKANYGSVKFDQ